MVLSFFSKVKYKKRIQFLNGLLFFVLKKSSYINDFKLFVVLLNLTWSALVLINFLQKILSQIEKVINFKKGT